MEGLNDTVDETNQQELPPHPVQLGKLLCYQVLGLPISLLGVIGNIICIIVWTRKRMQWGKSSTSCYLVGLAVSDLLYLLIINVVVLLPDYLHLENDHFIPIFNDTQLIHNVKSVAQPVTDIFANISIFYVVAFTIERFIAIRFPLRGLILCTPRRAISIISIGTVIIIILHIPDILEHVPMMENLGYSKSGAYRIGYNWGIMVLLFVITPILILAVFNTLLIKSVIKSKRIRRQMTAVLGSSASDTGALLNHTVLTVTIISVVILFLLCHTPSAVMLCVYTYRTHLNLVGHTESFRWTLAFASANLLSMLNSSLNFIIYSALSAKFRTTAMNLLCKFCDKPNKQLKEKTTNFTNDVTLYSNSKSSSNRCRGDELLKHSSESLKLINGKQSEPGV